MTQDKAQAAGAVSIDSPVLGMMLVDYRHSTALNEQHRLMREIIAFADAHAAQHYRQGYADMETISAAAVDRYSKRAEAADASLARLVEALQGITALYETDEGCRSTPEYIAAREVLALLPAKANTVAIGGGGFFAGCKVHIDPALPPDTVEMRGANTVRMNVRTGEVTATPAPAMGEELPPSDAERAAFNAWFDSWSDPNVGHVEHTIKRHAAIAAWQARACMALRQAGAEKLSATLSGTQYQAILEALKSYCLSYSCYEHDDSMNYQLIDLLTPEGQTIDKGQEEAIFIADAIYNSLNELTTPTAPVRQPAAQEVEPWQSRISNSTLEQWRKTTKGTNVIENALLGEVNDLRKALATFTAPAPLSAPAGSEQERGVNQFPAKHVIHTPSGPVNACEEHARQIMSFMKFVGSAVLCVAAESTAQCSNCQNEARQQEQSK